MKTAFPLLAWPALLLAGFAAPPATAAVTVHGTASSTGERITVQLHADITVTPLLSFGVRLLSDPAAVQPLSAIRNEAVWFFGASGGPIAYALPDLSRPGEVILIGGRMDTANPLQGVLGNQVLLGTVIYRRLSPGSPNFSLTQGRPGAFADFVTKFGAVLDGLSGEVTLAGIDADPEDKDLDGLRDAWETEFFGSPERAYFSDDGDKDGYDNRAEQELGTDPTKTESNLAFTIDPGPRDIELRWVSVKDRTYTVESSEDLEKFTPWQTGIAATPPLNTIALRPPTRPGALFYRIRLE